MKKNTILIIIIIFLLCIDIAFISSNSEKKVTKDIVINQLRFTERQINQYEKSILNYETQIEKKNNELVLLKEQFYSFTINESSEEIIRKFAKKIAHKNLEIEELHYTHLLEIKKVCRAEQLRSYEELIEKIKKITFTSSQKKRLTLSFYSPYFPIRKLKNI